MKILGPFESIWNYWIIVVDNDSCILVKLNLSSTIKEMFYNYVNTLTKKGIEFIKTNYNWIEISGDKAVKIELKKSKFGKHTLNFKNNDLPNKISILNRKEVNYYTDELKKALKSNFSIME